MPGDISRLSSDRKLDPTGPELEKASACAGVVHKLPCPEAVDTSDHIIDDLSQSLHELSLKIHDHPELDWDVRYAHDTLTEFLEERGFQITRHYLANRLPGNTAWRGINSEMDALPGLGHACGHNLVAIAGVAAALGLKNAMEKHDVPGKIIILGTPAEESGMGKERLLEAGAYQDMDVCLMAHPDPRNGRIVSTPSSLAQESFMVEYNGQSAHAGAAPWEGQNALDAAFIAYAALSALRQQIHPSARVHGIIEGRDWSPNVISDYAKMIYTVRAPTWNEAVALRARVNKCFEAAAHATSCTMTVTEEESTKDLRQNTALSDEFAAIMTTRHNFKFLPNDALGASTDFGNITYELPALHPSFMIPTAMGSGYHTSAFAAAARTQESHEIALAVSKGLAAVGLRVLLDQAFLQSAKAAHEKQ